MSYMKLLNEDLNNFHSMLLDTSINEDVVNNYVEKLRFVLTGTSLEEEFDFIENGSYKEVFALNEDFVVKFASQENTTELERGLLQKAKKEEILELFIPTWFCPLNTTELSLNELNESSYDRLVYDSNNDTYVENENWEPLRATYIILQPYVHKIVAYHDIKKMPQTLLEYEKEPIYDSLGEKIEFEYINMFGVDSYEWLKKIASLYGANFFRKAAFFIQENEITDLHNRNIGYYTTLEGKEIPVIFDWISP